MRIAAAGFDGVRIPADRRLGQEGQGLPIAVAGLDAGRLGRRREVLVHSRTPLVHQPQDRPVEEAVQQPDQDREVDRLEREGPPVDLHGQPV